MAEVKPPLEGIRVLDLGRHQAGPRCAQVLARLGAEVIKVERLEGEETRDHAPYARGQSAYWVQYNSSKKSLAMDMRREEAKEILRELVKISDVFIQNFRPGTIDKMGFGYDLLRGLNRRIIMVNISAYGQFGPYKDQIGFDPIGQAISGLMMVTGFEGMPPIRTGSPVVDRTTALHAVIGTLAALHERERSGEGQSLDLCLADSGYSLTEIPITAHVGGGELAKRGSYEGIPTGEFPCKDGWVLISAGDDHMWPRVCRALDRPEWENDPRFTKRTERYKNRTVIEEALKTLLADMAMKEAVGYLKGHDVVATPVNTIAQAAADPHPWERRALVEVEDAVAGKVTVSGDFWHFSRTPVVIGPIPTVGQHTEELLTGLLSYTSQQVEELRAKRVLA